MTPDEVARLETSLYEFRREHAEDMQEVLRRVDKNAQALVALNGRVRAAETFKARAEGAAALVVFLVGSGGLTAILVRLLGG